MPQMGVRSLSVFLRPRPGLVTLATAVAAVLCTAPSTAHAATTLPPGFKEVTLADSFSAPGSDEAVDVAWAPDGRMFVADRAGIVFVHNPGAPANQNVELLDITDHVNDAPGNDRGLLGIATDTNFASNGYRYLLYTYDEDDSDNRTNPKVSTLMRVVVHPNNTVDGGMTNPTETTLLGSVHTVAAGPDGACGAPDNTVDCIP